MMRICPVCDRPAKDLIRLEDILICDRCADSVDVEPALQNLDAAEWKDPSRSRSGKTAVGAAVRVGPRRLAWGAAGLAALIVAGAILASVRSTAPLNPSPAIARLPLATPKLAEIEPPAPPPPPARPETRAERVRRILDDARPRVRRIASLRRGEAAELLQEARSVERSLREAAFLEPGNRELLRLQGRLYAALGRYDEALSALGKGASGDPALHLDRLEIVITAHLMLDRDEAKYPSVVRALRLRLAARHGGPLEEPAGPLIKAFAYAVSRDFAEAKGLLGKEAEERVPEARRSELPFVRAMLDYLEGDGWPTGLRPALRASARTAYAAPEVSLWLVTLRRRPRRQAGAPALTLGNPVHGAVLRGIADERERAGELREALERLDLALLAQPRNVPLRLERARVLAKLGERKKAVEAYEAAAGVAATLGLPQDAIREISELKRA